MQHDLRDRIRQAVFIHLFLSEYEENGCGFWEDSSPSCIQYWSGEYSRCRIFRIFSLKYHKKYSIHRCTFKGLFLCTLAMIAQSQSTLKRTLPHCYLHIHVPSHAYPWVSMPHILSQQWWQYAGFPNVFLNYQKCVNLKKNLWKLSETSVLFKNSQIVKHRRVHNSRIR